MMATTTTATEWVEIIEPRTKVNKLLLKYKGQKNLRSTMRFKSKTKNTEINCKKKKLH